MNKIYTSFYNGCTRDFKRVLDKIYLLCVNYPILFLVRYFWITLEVWRVNNLTAHVKIIKRKKVELRLMKWTQKQNKILIAGKYIELYF